MRPKTRPPTSTTPVGLGILVAGLAFLTVGWRLLPGGRRAQASPEAAFQVEPYVSEARLTAGSPLVGKTVADLFLTPIGHQCNTLVMGPGGYKFGDFWRLGLPLSVIVVLVGTAVIPLVWPIQ